MMLRTGQDRQAYLAAVKRISSLTAEGQDVLLRRIGERISAVEVRLLDPSSFKLRTAMQRRKAATTSVPPRANRAARLQAAMKLAETKAFAVANEEITQKLRGDLKLYKHPVRLSSLSLQTARDVLQAMQTVEAVRNTPAKDLRATRLPGRVENEFYSGFDYEIDFKNEK
jgi:hypothetical protein